MSKDNKNQMTPDPEDQTRDFPPGTSATAGLDPGRTEDPSAEPKPQGPWHPTKAGAAAEQHPAEVVAQEGAPGPARAVQDEHGVVHPSAGVSVRRTQRRVVEPQLGQPLAGVAREIAQDEVALMGDGERVRRARRGHAGAGHEEGEGARARDRTQAGHVRAA